MKILKLNLRDVLGCSQFDLNFCGLNNVTPPVYFIQSSLCPVFTAALQLICSAKYDTMFKLNEIWPEVRDGEIRIVFLMRTEKRKTATVVDPEDHSSDSDVPCTSQQAKKRADRRRSRRLASARDFIVVRASRFFGEDPFTLKYRVDSGPILKCTISEFNQKFFSCTDVILPSLSSLMNDGDCCCGRWLDLFSTDFVYPDGKGGNSLLLKFCELYAARKIRPQDPLCLTTTSVLVGRYSLDQTRIGCLVKIFQDIRSLFEYLTFSEYTVWFLLPQLCGDLKDIKDIKTNSINFDLMRTQIQMKTPEAKGTASFHRYDWTDAVGYIRELFLIAVQLAFGFSCRQDIICLHSLHELQKHLSLEYVSSNFTHQSGKEMPTYKDYLQRIVNVCGMCNLCCIVPFMLHTPFPPKNCFIVNDGSSNEES